MQDKDGEWFDLDTGIYFHEYNPPQKDQTPRYSPSAKTAEARAKARKNGGRALRGSSKQKEWAEKIRMQKLSALNDEQKQMVLRLDVLHAAKFWIEQRDRQPLWFFDLAKKLVQLIGFHNALNRLGSESFEFDQKPMLSPRTSAILRERDQLASAIDGVARGEVDRALKLQPDDLQKSFVAHQQQVSDVQAQPKPKPPQKPLFSRLADVRQSIAALNPETQPLRLIVRVRDLLLMLKESAGDSHV